MKSRIAWRLALVCAVLGASAAMASSASAVLIHASGTVFGKPRAISITPMRGVTIPKARIYTVPGVHPRDSNGNLDYNGGGVFHGQSPYVIFWVPSGEASDITSTTESLISRYFTDVAHDSGLASNVYGVLRQYYDTHGFANYSQVFSAGTQAIVDTDAYPATDSVNCPNTGPEPSGDPCITDSQVQTELANFTAAHGLPNDGADPTNLGANAPEYYVVLPANVNECSDAADCADNVYCAYHTAMGLLGGDGLVYSMIPLMGTELDFGSGAGKGCQYDGNPNVQAPNGDQQGDISIKYISHEQSESITDPVVGQGWYNFTNGQEIGDECNFAGPFDPTGDSNPSAFQPTLGGSASSGNLYDQLDNGNPYYIQSEWSNGDVGAGGCEMKPSGGAMSANLGGAPTSNVPVGTTVSFTAAASSSNGYSSVTLDFGDGSTSFDSSGSGPTAAYSHTYTQAGRYTAKLIIVDPQGDETVSSESFVIGSPPSPAFATSAATAVQGRAISFTGGGSDPDAGVTFASYLWNFGDGSTGSGANVNHAYSRPGTYTVTFAVVNSIGLMNIVTHTVTITKATITKVKVTHKTKKGATIVVTVNAAGKVSGAGKSKTAGGAGSVSLKLKLSKAQLAKLASKGNLTLHVKVTYKPNVGSIVHKKVTIKFKA
jgi:PKD repeat protein